MTAETETYLHLLMSGSNFLLNEWYSDAVIQAFCDRSGCHQTSHRKSSRDSYCP